MATIIPKPTNIRYSHISYIFTLIEMKVLTKVKAAFNIAFNKKQTNPYNT